MKYDLIELGRQSDVIQDFVADQDSVFIAVMDAIESACEINGYNLVDFDFAVVVTPRNRLEIAADHHESWAYGESPMNGQERLANMKENSASSLYNLPIKCGFAAHIVKENIKWCLAVEEEVGVDATSEFVY